MGEILDEEITGKMLEKWFSGFVQPGPSKSARLGKLEIEIGPTSISLRNPKTGFAQIINPADLGVVYLGKEAKLLVGENPAEKEHLAYVFIPGAENVMELGIAFEGEFFGIYPHKCPLGFPLSGKYCANVNGKNLLVCDFEKKEYVFFNERGERLHSSIECGGGSSCVVLNADTAAICTSEILFVIRKGKRVGIKIKNAIGKKIKKPVFGFGKSRNHEWLAVKDERGKEVLLVCLTDPDLGYAAMKLNELKGKELMD